MTTTLTFVAHQDDDLIFMNPDVASDEQAGYNVWVVYLTAGQDDRGMDYADQRIQGARAAHARAAKVPNEWTYEALQLAGHEVATNTLNGTNIRLVFTFIRAASGAANDPDGDLYRMWFDPTFEAQPIDGRPAYTRSSLLAMLSALISTAKPDYIRTQNTIANRTDPEHVDHIAGALFAAEADTSADRTLIPRYEYYGYVISNMPANWEGYWVDEKQAIFEEYAQYDPEAAGWVAMKDRQYQRMSYASGDQWVARTDHF